MSVVGVLVMALKDNDNLMESLSGIILGALSRSTSRCFSWAYWDNFFGPNKRKVGALRERRDFLIDFEGVCYGFAFPLKL